MKKVFYLFLMLFFASCVNQIDSDIEPVREGDVKISFFGRILPAITRMQGDKFDADDEVGLYAVIANSSLKNNRYVDNLLLKSEGDNRFLSKDDVFYPEGGFNLDFYAYYPYRKDAVVKGDTKMLVSVNENQESNDDFFQSDFLVAKQLNVMNGEDKVVLDFKHKLTRMNIQLVFEDEASAEEALKSNPSVMASDYYTKAMYDFSVDEFLNLSGLCDMFPHGIWKRNGAILQGKDLLVIPQGIENQRILVDVAGRIFTCAPQETDLQQGCQHIYSINIDELTEGVVNEISATISDWETGEPQEVEGEVKLTSLKINALSFNVSNVYHVHYEGMPIAEICKEYLYKEGVVDSRAIVLYLIENGDTNLENGVVLKLLDEIGDVHGGIVSWNKENNELSYSPGNLAPILNLYIDVDGKIVTSKPNELKEFNVSSYTLRDVRNGELQNYPLVKIATQYWMGEDLSTKYYVNGSLITEISMLNGTAGYAMNADGSHYFYTGEAVNTGLMAPKGTRVPTNVDWKKLKVYLGDNTDALKSGIWNPLNGQEYYPGNGKSEFEMLPSGLYIEYAGNTRLLNEGSYTAYWMASEQNGQIHESDMVCQFSSNINVFKSVSAKVEDKDYYHAFSIRCIKE